MLFDFGSCSPQSKRLISLADKEELSQLLQLLRESLKAETGGTSRSLFLNLSFMVYWIWRFLLLICNGFSLA